MMAVRECSSPLTPSGQEQQPIATHKIDADFTKSGHSCRASGLLSFSEENLLQCAAFASDKAKQEPIDPAIFAHMKAKGVQRAQGRRTAYAPFEPSTKLSQATIRQDEQIL